MRAPNIFIRSLRRALNRAGLLVTAALLLAAGATAAVAGGQASQPSPASNETPQTTQPAQQNSAGPMVMGQDPDSTPDTVNAPAAAQPSPAASQTASPGAQAPRNSSSPPSTPPATSAARPAPPPSSAALPVPPPANAGGDAARQQINNECVNLLKMANELKAAVDKSNKDTLSITVVRKADDIEALAHQVKDEMRPEIARQ